MLHKINIGILFLTTFLAISALFPCTAQNNSNIARESIAATNVIWPAKLQKEVEFLCDSICDGRATGTRGNIEAGFHILRKFEKIGLLPLISATTGDTTFVKHFYAGKGMVGHNIIGMVAGSKKNPCDRYVIVGAHYDHIGNLAGTMYPGADANASGTVAMISLAEMFRAMKILGCTFKSNILFVAFDSKEMNLAGSNGLWEMLERGDLLDPLSGKPIRSSKISLMLNIDQVGCTLSPVSKDRPDYLIMLGNHSLPTSKRDALKMCNRMYGLNLHLSYDYYGSRNFTDIFYTLSDQKVFVQNHIPAVLFTSGITMNNNKKRDLPNTLDYDIFHKRIELMHHWLCKML